MSKKQLKKFKIYEVSDEYGSSALEVVEAESAEAAIKQVCVPNANNPYRFEGDKALLLANPKIGAMTDGPWYHAVRAGQPAPHAEGAVLHQRYDLDDGSETGQYKMLTPEQAEACRNMPPPDRPDLGRPDDYRPVPEGEGPDFEREWHSTLLQALLGGALDADGRWVSPAGFVPMFALLSALAEFYRDINEHRDQRYDELVARGQGGRIGSADELADEARDCEKALRDASEFLHKNALHFLGAE